MKPIHQKKGRREYNATFDDIAPGTRNPLGLKIGGRDKNTRGRFVPNINISRWDDRCWLNINHTDRITTERETFDGSTIALSVNGHTHRFYLTKTKEIEYEIVLQKPEILEFDLDFPEGLEFYYQWPLADYWYAESLNGTREVLGCKTLEEYLRCNTRPENVEGSYAVRWGKAQGVGDGDFCHIFRPKLIDANGKERWADIFIEPIEKKLRIECNFEGLIFPVTVDPTIGTPESETTGWTNYSAAALDMICWKASCGTDGTTDDGTAYIYCQQYSGNGAKVALGIYEDETGGGGTKAPEGASQFSNGDTGELAAPVSMGYVSGVISFSTGLVSSTDYWLCLALDKQCYISWKAGATDQTGYTTGWTYASPIGDPLPVTVLADLARYWRWRVDYTEDTGEEITVLCRKRFFPTDTVSNNGWSPDSGSTTDAVKTNEHYLYSATENALIYYRFEVPDIYNDTENVLGARLRFEGQRESANKRHFRPYLYMGAAEYYGTKANEVNRLTVLPDAAHQLYLEYPLDPTDDSTWVIGDFADIQAGLKICTNDGVGEDLENVEDADPGARINELILELILAPNATDAYMTHWLGFGGATNNRLRVGVRTNQAAKVRIMYGPVEADVKSSEIGSLDGDTLATDDPASDNAVSVDDFCVHIDITGLTYPETYYFDVYIDGVSMYEFESGSEAYSFWYTLPSCATLPPSDTFVAKDVVCIGDFHDSPLEKRAFASMTGLADKDICMFIRLGDTHSQHSDVLNIQTKDSDAVTRVAAMAGCREGWQSRVGFQLPSTYYVEEVLKQYPTEGIYSDHDFVGDNATKTGHIPRYQRQDGGLPPWQKNTHQLDNGTQIDILADGGASYSNESIIKLTNQGETANTRINMNVDGYTVEIKGSVSNDGFYVGVTGKDYGAESVIKCGSAMLTNESTVGTYYEEGEDVGAQVETYQHRTWNSLKVFKEYNPSYDYALPVDLTGQATAGSAATLQCDNTEYRQFTYGTLTGDTPTVRTYTNGYWVAGDAVSWNSGADTGELVYHNVTDKVMVIKLDSNTSPLDTDDTVADDEAGVSWSVDVDSNVFTFPKESIYGVYPGMMVYHGANEDLDANPSWSTVNSNSGTVLTFNTALRIGSEAFANNDYFRVKRELLCRSFWVGKCQFWIIDIRNKSDREAIIGEGLAGCDWLDGTREFVDAKLSGSCGSPSAGKLIGTGLSDAVEGDVVYNVNMWRMTTSSADSTNYPPAGTLAADDAVTWSGSDGGTLIEVGTDEHGNPELCVLQTSGTTPPAAGDKIEKDGANYTYVFGDIRNEAQVAKIGGTHNSTQVELEDTYGSGSQTINLFPGSGYGYEVCESGGSNHGTQLANEKAGHIQREWLVADMNGSSAEWKFIVCETPIYGVLTISPGNQFQLLPTIDPLDCLRQYLFS